MCIGKLARLLIQAGVAAVLVARVVAVLVKVVVLLLIQSVQQALLARVLHIRGVVVAVLSAIVCVVLVIVLLLTFHATLALGLLGEHRLFVVPFGRHVAKSHAAAPDAEASLGRMRRHTVISGIRRL